MSENLNEDGILGGSLELSIKLPIFEGPLDLLLFLLKKNEIDIYDIPIGQITAQYLAVIREMKDLSLDIAGEFFVMASNLMYIKSRMLLPSDERLNQAEENSDDADADPRWELVEQLLEYKKIKEGAILLEDLIIARQDCLPRLAGEKTEPLERPLKNSDRIEIWNTFNNVLRRLAEKLVEGEIVGEQVSVSDRMEFILNLESDTFSFSSLFEKGKTTVAVLVASFLAVLELARLGRLSIAQDENFSEIFFTKLEEKAPEAPAPDSIEANLDTWEGDAPQEEDATFAEEDKEEFYDEK